MKARILVQFSLLTFENTKNKMDSRVVKALMLFITISLIQLVASRNMTDMSKELDRQLISLPQKPVSMRTIMVTKIPRPKY